MIEQLLSAKGSSDKRDYQQKYRKIRDMMSAAPNDWIIDSQKDAFFGVTHVPTGFQYHLPLAVVPGNIKKVKPQTAKVAAEDFINFKCAAPATALAAGIKPVSAIKAGKMTLVHPDEIEYEAVSPSHMYTETSHMSPLSGNMKGARLFINSKYASQALPLKDAEAPLVDTIDEDTGNSYSHTIGNKIGMIHAKNAGTVHSVHNNTINILGDDGKMYGEDLHYYYPSNRKTSRTDKPLVTTGDRIEAGQAIAHSNYVTPEGIMAPGKNLRVAFVPGPHGSTFEDSIAVSQSAANRLTSQHLYGYDIEHKHGVESSKKKFVSLFPNKYTNEQLDKIGEDGHALPGSKLSPGDPVLLAYQPRNLSTKDAALGNLHKVLRNSYQDLTQTWEKPSPGIIADAIKTRKGLTVNVATDMPLRQSDKISQRFGAKGIVGKIFPDDKMFRDATGKPVDILINPAAIIGRVNPGMIYEALLGKVALKTGKPYHLPAFGHQNTLEWVTNELKKHGVESNEDLFDPETGRKVPNVLTGQQYFLKLEHTSESKISGRGEDSGHDLNEQPSKGGSEGAKRLGGLVNNALLSHGALEVLRDAKLNRGSKNSEMWTRIRNGEAVPAPKVPFIFNKFVSLMKGAGINMERRGNKFHLFAMTDKDVDAMARHEITNAETVDPHTTDPIPGGLFDQSIHGADGSQWSKIALDRPIPNPLMEDPIRSFLQLTKPKYREIIAGREFLNGKTGTEAIHDALKGLNFSQIEQDARNDVRNGRASKRDEAVRRLSHAVGMQKMNLSPDDLMTSKVPVIPPTYRPVSKMGGMLLVSDPNYLYGDLIKAQRALKINRNDLPDSELGDEKLAVYDALKAVQGLGDPVNPETQQKGVKGFIRTIAGSGGPKTGIFLAKVVGHPVNTVGRSVISPNADLNMDQVGIPEKMAWNMYQPFTMGRMVRDGMPSTEAAKHLERHSAVARKYLLEEMEYRPALVSRDPALHRFSIMGAHVKLVPGSSIHLSPLVVKGYGADFDGDAMNIHIPVSDQAVREVKEKLLPSKNLLNLKDRTIFSTPTQESILGLNNATTPNSKKPVSIFNTKEEAKQAYHKREIDLDTPIHILND